MTALIALTAWFALSYRVGIIVGTGLRALEAMHDEAEGRRWP